MSEATELAEALRLLLDNMWRYAYEYPEKAAYEDRAVQKARWALSRFDAHLNGVEGQ